MIRALRGCSDAQKLCKRLGLGLAMMAMTITAAQGFDGTQKLNSSVMWQISEDPAQRFVYPPGVPAVLRPAKTATTLRVEQYYSQPVDSASISIDLHGSWPETDENSFVRDESRGWSGRYVTVSAPACDNEQTLGGYRCVLDVKVSPETPSGTIGLSTSLNISGRSFGHQNGVFWIILPEMNAPHHSRPFTKFDLSSLGLSQRSMLAEESPYPALPALHRERAKRATVQITLEGNFSLGTGFFVANAESIFPVFGSEMATKLRSLPANTRFIVTAAHLFPLSYGFSTRGQIQNILENSESLFDDGETYDLLVAGNLYEKAGRLLVTNMESDLALLALSPDAETKILGTGSMTELDLFGLNIARSMNNSVALDVFGYPVSGRGEITHRRGYLPPNGWPTDDTSNFGPLIKFKLQAIDTSINLAEAGLSGGPIVNFNGEVVGLSMERPNDTNSLVAIDLTSLSGLPANWLGADSECRLSFNPFDRVLRIIRNNESCSYGRFGSPQKFSALTGEWSMQEVFGFADEN